MPTLPVPPKLSIVGRFQRLTVSILLDASLPTSLISNQFVVDNSLPRTIHTDALRVATMTLTGDLHVATSTGGYVSQVSLLVASVPAHDLVLGQDWFVGCACRVSGGLLLDPILPLSAGHCWSPVRPFVPFVEPVTPQTPVESNPLACAGFERLSRAQLVCRLCSHGIDPPLRTPSTVLRGLLVAHLSNGDCVDGASPACETIRAHTFHAVSDVDDLRTAVQVQVLSSVQKYISRKPLCRLLTEHHIVHSSEDTLRTLRRRLRSFVAALTRGKSVASRNLSERERYALRAREAEQDRLSQLSAIRAAWPTPIASTLKDKLLQMFREETGSDALRSFACACCAEQALVRDRHVLAVQDLPLDILRCPPDLIHENPLLPLPLAGLGSGLDDVLLVRDSLVDNYTKAHLCGTCARGLARGHLPDLAMANYTYIGPPPPPELQLSMIEEVMVALCRAKCCIVHLKDEEEVKRQRDVVLPNMQRGLKGNIIIHPQRPGPLLSILPATIEDMLAMVCVVFVGARPPTREWLRDKAKPLAARPDRIRKALHWLKQHNPLYKDVVIDENIIQSLPADGVLPFNIEVVRPSAAQDALASRYDASEQMATYNAPEADASSPATPFQNVVITDVDVNAPSSELRAAAIRHLKERGGSFILVPHDDAPVNEFCDPTLFPKLYPTLYPYGIGGFEDGRRQHNISLKRHARHLFSMADRRFQTHTSFMFIVFNVLQRREVLLRSMLKVKKSSFAAVATDLAAITNDAVARVCARVAEGDYITANDADERRVLKLMREVRMVSTSVPGSSASRLQMRNHIRATMHELGSPTFYLTLNPADIYNPLVKFLAGADIDIDKLLPDEVPGYWEQSILVARNPFVASRFFDIYMKAFIKCLLEFDPSTKRSTADGGVLGHVSAYYGCVESQGRGTLHCHMVVWIEGGLNPNDIQNCILSGDAEFATRLLAYLDDAISTELPPEPDDAGPAGDKPHPCSIRGISSDLEPAARDVERQRDVHRLAKACQSHTHTLTCFKYCKPGEPKECRFDLDPSNVISHSSYSTETGEICLRCLDGLVNNFNDTILEAIRCNMDIKFIASGEAAKAVTFYITDYITKPGLKAYVAYAALELAVQRMEVVDVEDSDDRVRAKRLLQKCAFALLNQQEMPAPQVAMFLEGGELSYHSHEYTNLYWTTLEHFIDAEDPSPECYSTAGPLPTSSAVDDAPVLDDDLHSDDASTIDGSDVADADDDNDIDAALCDEVTITADDAGKYVALTDQLSDYVYRGNKLFNINAWDFARSVEKVTGSSDAVDDCEPLSVSQLMDVLSDPGKRRPLCPLGEDHPEHGRRHLKIINPRARYMTVPIGPALTRRDRPELYPKYCRLMLLLFKPWRSARDLREPGQSWADAFSAFELVASSDVKRVIKNIQFLHECKDSREDHFRNRAHLKRARMSAIAREVGHVENDLAEDSEDIDINAHLDEVEGQTAFAKASAAGNLLACLTAAERYGLYTWKSCQVGDTAERDSVTHVELDTAAPSGSSLEKDWSRWYEERKVQWKKSQLAIDPGATPAGALNPHGLGLAVSIQSMAGGSSDTSFHSPARGIDAYLAPPVSELQPHADFAIDHFIQKWTLNVAQCRVFTLIATKALTTASGAVPLRMFLGGCGGTGKSRVIDALRDFFTSRGEERRLRLAAYTGIAAKNIAGMTLHSVLGLNTNGKLPAHGSKGHHDLVSMWEGVDFLFVDEVSMAGCEMVAKLSRGLSLAKGCDEPFGGINVVFAGDFAQLPPVGEARLFGHVDTASTKGSEAHRQEVILGKLLWLSVDTVIVLREQMRQAGAGNKPFTDLLMRLRTGECTSADFDLLNTRLLSNSSHELSHAGWDGAPVLVYDNATKDALNTRAVAAYAASTKQSMHWYYARDRHKGREFADPVLRDRLYRKHTGETEGLLGKIPLVTGMRVIVSKNFDVAGGIVNGSIGTLTKARYVTNMFGERQLKSCVIHLPDGEHAHVTGLADDDVPILEDTKSYTVGNKYSKKRLSIRRTQVAVQPAYAFTSHRAQGQTYSNVVLDLESCVGTESPYVMLSRATSLDALMILRPFKRSRINVPPAEGLRTEWRRLRHLEILTLLRIVTGLEAVDLQTELATLQSPPAPVSAVPCEESAQLSAIDNLQKTVNRCFGARATRDVPARKKGHSAMLAWLHRPSDLGCKVADNAAVCRRRL